MTISTTSSPVQPKQWTVLFYMDGNNNLAPMARTSFDVLTKVGSNDDVNLVAEVSIKGSGCVERGLVENKARTGEAMSHKEVLPIKDMSSPDTLYDFLVDSMKKYPAKHFALVMWDHGAGFMGSMADDYSGGILTNLKLAETLKKAAKDAGKSVELVNFNACLMGQMEVACDLEGTGAKYLTGSEEVEAGLRFPLPGLDGTTPQRKVMEDLEKGIKEKGEITPEELAKLYVYEAKHQFGSKLFTPTQSAIALDRIPKVKATMDTLASLFIDEMKRDPRMKKILRSDMNGTQHYLNFDIYQDPYKDYRDLGHFAKVVAGDRRISSTPIKETAKQLLQAVQEAVVAEHHSLESFSGEVMEDSSGLSTYLNPHYGYDRPADGSKRIKFSPTHGYEKTRLASETKWDEMLQMAAEDKTFHRLLTKVGLSEEKIQSIEKVLAVPKQWAQFILPMATWEGYPQAHDILSGFRSWNIFTPLAILGGGIRTWRGLKHFTAAAHGDWKGSKKVESCLRGGMDTVIGAGSVALGVAAMAGAATMLAPLAAVVLGLGIGRTAYGLLKGKADSDKAANTPVSEKIQEMTKKP